jgi:hypothetical protein
MLQVRHQLRNFTNNGEVIQLFPEFCQNSIDKPKQKPVMKRHWQAQDQQHNEG